MVLTTKDESTTKIGVGNAAVQVGRAVDEVTYLTTGEDLTEILTPAIDASVARLRTALGTHRHHCVNRRLVLAVALLVVLAATVALGAPGRVRARRPRSDQRTRACWCPATDRLPRRVDGEQRASSTDDAAIDAQAAKIASCKRSSAFSKANKKNPRAKSPTSTGERRASTNTVSVFPSTAKASAAMPTFADTRVPALSRAAVQCSCSRPVGEGQEGVEATGVGEDRHRAGSPACRSATRRSSTRARSTSASRTARPRPSGSRSSRCASPTPSTAYSYTANTDISAALQPAIVASVSRLGAATSST